MTLAAGCDLSPGLTVNGAPPAFPPWPSTVDQSFAVKAGQDLAGRDDRSAGVLILLEGWACRQTTLPDGRRQILGFVLPGDSCTSWGGGPGRHAVRALTRGRAARWPADRTASSSGMNTIQGNTFAREHARMSAWLLNLGQRKAPERIAHLFCELAHRLDANGPRGPAPGYDLPLTQQDLADALGLTCVHINRVLQRMRAGALIGFRRGVISLHDLSGLVEIAGSDFEYLQV